MKAAEYRNMSIDELRAHEEDLRRSVFTLRTRSTTKELEDISRIKQERRELARLLTVLNEKIKEEAAPSQA